MGDSLVIESRREAYLIRIYTRRAIINGTTVFSTPAGVIRCVPGEKSCAIVASGGTTWNTVKTGAARAAGIISGDFVTIERCTKSGEKLCLSIDGSSCWLLMRRLNGARR